MAKSYQADYPFELIATLAAQLLGEGSGTDETLFTKAAERACRLLDVCEDVGRKHYKAVNDLRPVTAPLENMLESITGIKGRPGHALKNYREFFRCRVKLFALPTDDQSIPVDNPKSEAHIRMMEALAKHEQAGISEDELAWIKPAYSEWRTSSTSKARSRASAKRKPVRKKAEEDQKRTSEGKFKKKKP